MQHLKLKKETSLFEWFNSDLFAINEALANINWLEDDASVVGGRDGRVVIANEYLYSYHYKLAEYKDIFIRRKNRFYETIKAKNAILFVRLDAMGFNTTLDEILVFRDILEHIMTDISKVKFMLISTVKNEKHFVPYKHDFILHKYILEKDTNDFLMKDDIKIQKQVKAFLEEAGVSMTVSDVGEFTDKS